MGIRGTVGPCKRSAPFVAVLLAAALLSLGCGAEVSDAAGSAEDTARDGTPVRSSAPAIPSVGTLDAAIGADELERHLSFLASDELAGRAAGTPQIARAEEYIAAQFEAAGLEPISGEDDYFLEFDLYEAVYDSAATFVRFGDDLSGSVDHDFRPFWFSRDGSVSAALVFAGYGITAPEHGYDDYDGLDVEGRIVFVLRHEPNENDPDSVFAGTEHSEHAYFTTKAENAARHGAAGMVLVTDPLHHDEREHFHPMRRLSLEPDVGFPEGPMSADVPDGFVAVHLSQRLGAAAAQAMGGDLAEMQRAVDEGTTPAEMSLSSIDAQVSVEPREAPRRFTARNVAGYLPPTDADLASGADAGIVLIGAHHDHLGSFRGAGDTIYNGADDNASGTAGVLELAEHFARNGERRERGMVFATFTAEEWGLFGARAVVTHGLLPVGRIELMVNLDMIGRNPNGDVRVYGGRSASDAVSEAAAANGLSVAVRSHSRRSASDHSVFLEEGIDALFFHTGLHDDYHTVDDEAELIDFGHMRAVVELVADTVRRAGTR